MLEVARIAFDDLALFRNADFEKRLSVIHRPAGIGDQAVRGAMSGMHMGVDEARRDELAGGIDRGIGGAIEGFPDLDDPVALENDDAVADQPMASALMADDPARSDDSPHDDSLPAQPPIACSRPLPRTDHEVKRASRNAKIAYIPIPMTPTTISAAKMSGTLKFELAISITLPMPLLPAIISAMTV